jgi:glucose dehydrogenase
MVHPVTRAATRQCFAVLLAIAGGSALAQSRVDDQTLLDPPSNKWLTYGGDYGGQHFSRLTQIERSNVDRLTVAWDPVANREVWRAASDGPSPTLSTAGGLLFLGGGGRIYAHDPATGAVLCSHEVGGSGMATPVTYEIDGRQFIAAEFNSPGRVIAFALPEED